MRKIHKLISVLLIMTLLIACKKGDDSSGDEQQNPGDPTAVTLVFPDNNRECTEGIVISDSESTIKFQWQASSNTDSYEVMVRNLDLNSTATVSVNTNEADITLQQNTPYEWFVVSKVNGNTATAESGKWRFYNAGNGVENYAPFPADAISPTRGQTVSATGTVILEWSGNDVDNDIEEFEVFFGTSNDPTVSIANTPQSSTTANVTSGQTYYWQVISKDAVGNTSQSEVFDFRVQ